MATDPKPWIVPSDERPDWLTEAAKAELWPSWGFEQLRAELAKYNVREVRLTPHDEEPWTLNFDRDCRQTLDMESPYRFNDAFTNGIEKLRANEEEAQKK